MAYRRFRDIGIDKVKMDFAFFAIAFNLKKICAKLAKATNDAVLCSIMSLLWMFISRYTLNEKTFRKINNKKIA